MASLLAKLITGRYDFYFLPIPLPTSYVVSLLPKLFQSAPSPFFTTEELKTLGIDVPFAGEGFSWGLIEAGRQINTGMRGVPGGKSDFFEAKLQIPFLRHPTNPSVPFTYKQTLLFSSYMMSISGSFITGLTTHKTIFVEDVAADTYEATGWIEISQGQESTGGQKWSEALMRSSIGGWWIGDRTKETASKFIMSDLSPPVRKQLKVRLHLAAFASEVKSILDSPIVDDWREFEVPGWRLSMATQMEACDISTL